MTENEKRKVFEELLEEYQNVIESEFSYDDGEREAEHKAWLNKYNGVREPLIKDEKVRKAVRFKAEALADAIKQSAKEFIDDIAELCGEEEE